MDIDLPVSLTQHDRVEIPVAVYNYLPAAAGRDADAEAEPWFTLEGAATQTVHVEAGQVKVVYYPIIVEQHRPHRADRDGTGQQTLRCHPARRWT